MTDRTEFYKIYPHLDPKNKKGKPSFNDAYAKAIENNIQVFEWTDKEGTYFSWVRIGNIEKKVKRLVSPLFKVKVRRN